MTVKADPTELAQAAGPRHFLLLSQVLRYFRDQHGEAAP